MSERVSLYSHVCIHAHTSVYWCNNTQAQGHIKHLGENRLEFSISKTRYPEFNKRCKCLGFFHRSHKNAAKLHLADHQADKPPGAQIADFPVLYLATPAQPVPSAQVQQSPAQWADGEPQASSLIATQHSPFRSEQKGATNRAVTCSAPQTNRVWPPHPSAPEKSPNPPHLLRLTHCPIRWSTDQKASRDNAHLTCAKHRKLMHHCTVSLEKQSENEFMTILVID